MMPTDEDRDDLAESIRILATNDEQLKSFGQMFANDSARKILQLLFNEELTAAQISLKTDISLQLTKYHIQKLQELGIVRVTKISKNSKSHDMKHYTAKSFSVVVVPPKLSEKTKSSKLLVHSFRHIYKVAGFGIAAGISGMFSALQLQGGSRPVQDFTSASSPAGGLGGEGVVEGGGGAETASQTGQQDPLRQEASLEEAQRQDAPQAMPDAGDAMMEADRAPQEDAATADVFDGEPVAGDAMMEADRAPQEDAATADVFDGEPVAGEPLAEENPVRVVDESSDASEPSGPPEVQEDLSGDGIEPIEIVIDVTASSAPLPPSVPFPELFFPLIAITAVLGGLAVFYLVKHLKGS